MKEKLLMNFVVKIRKLKWMNPKKEIFERQENFVALYKVLNWRKKKTFKCKFLLMYIVRWILVVRLKNPWNFTFYSLLMMTNNVLGGQDGWLVNEEFWITIQIKAESLSDWNWHKGLFIKSVPWFFVEKSQKKVCMENNFWKLDVTIKQLLHLPPSNFFFILVNVKTKKKLKQFFTVGTSKAHRPWIFWCKENKRNEKITHTHTQKKNKKKEKLNAGKTFT